MKIIWLVLLFVAGLGSTAHAQLFFEKVIGQSLQIDQFRAPDDVAVDAAGNIYIVDGISNQIKKLDASGNPISQWGIGGSGNGAFNIANSIAIDAAGNMYISDKFNARVQKFTSSGVHSSNVGAGAGSGDGQFNQPHGIAVDAIGNIYVVDNVNHRIQKFNSAGVFVSKWGTRGSGDGQFEFPQAIAIDAAGNVYVADTNNNRIQKFNASGQFQAKWGSNGNADGQFNYPQGIAVDASGNVYVSDSNNNRIQKFNLLGVFITKTGSFGSGNGEFFSPRGLEVDAAGNLYVADWGNKRIQKFNSALSFQNAWGKPASDGQLNSGNFNSPTMAIDNQDNIYVADLLNHQIQKFNSAGNVVLRWGSLGSGNNQFSFPSGIALDSDGNIYVADNGNHRITKFNSSGSYLTKWGGLGTTDGQLLDPKGIAIDASNNVYVLDRGNNRVQKFSSSGSFISKWGSLGIGNGDLNSPEGIAVDKDGFVYVADTQNNRLQKFTSSGTYVTKWDFKNTQTGVAIPSPLGIAVSGSNAVFVTGGSNHLLKFTTSGDFILSYGTYGWTNGTLWHPRGVVADAIGNVYVADGNHRIQKFAVLDILSLSNNSGTVSSSFTISGSGFSSVPSENVVKINSTVCTVTATSPNSLTVTVPAGATTGKVSVTRGGFTVQSADEFLVLPLAITSFSPAVSAAGGTITITGSGFSSVPANNIVKFNGVQATVTASTATSLVATLPAGNTLGKITVTVNGVTASSTNDFSGVLALNSFSPVSGLAGSSVTITGSGFGNAISSQQVFFNGTAAAVTASSLSSVTVTVPAGATTGKISITREGTTVTSAAEFVALPLAISSFTPSIGLAGSSVVITGTGFSSVPANNVVSFNGVPAVVTASSATSASVNVPATATSGKITVTTGGVSATSSIDFKITKLAITATSFPEFYVVDNPNVSVTIGLNDIAHFQSLKINSKGITQQDNAISSNAIAFASAANSLQVNIPASFFSDPLGLSYWFTAIDKDGNEINSAKGYTYLKYPASSGKQIIPSLINGKSAAAYQLIAVPLELTNKTTTNVFKALGSYDDKKWRLFNLSSAQEITERPQTINAGSGYWFISKDLVEINPGEGAVPKANQDAPFKINLVKGWNLIGNPYNFSISWNDVLARNNLTEQQIKLRQFINGAFVAEPLLKTYRGAFVESDIARTIEIPVINKSASGGRSTSSDSPPVGDAQWQVNFAVNDGAITNALYGLGMHPLASAEKDLWDEALLPMVEGLASYDLSFKTTQSLLMKSVVPTANDNSWVADLAAGQEITLTWDNSFDVKDDKKLVLDISDRVELVDMQKSNQVKIPAGKHTLKFHFGSADYIEKQVLDNVARIGNVFPNPVSISESSLHIPISLPEGDNEVMLELTDITGKSLGLSAAFKLPGGRQVLLWNADFKTLRDGMFLLKVSTFNPDQKTKSVYQKIVVK
jgi:tripartite motif-containing protein 71